MYHLDFVLLSWLLLFAGLWSDSLCRPTDNGEAIGALAPPATIAGLTSHADNNAVRPYYRLGSRPGGLRLITEGDKDVRIIFLFDFKPVHLFPKQFARRNTNFVRNIITKDDV